MSNLAIFIIGFVILIAGLAYGANMAGMSPQWIADQNHEADDENR